jgi:hypothetical protein
MSTPSPGPGWWLASDGHWYPQKWEYKTTHAWRQPSAQDATEALESFVTDMGQEGWEMVGFALNDYRESSVTLVIYWKRPIAP